MGKRIDLTGQVFGRLTALEYVGRNKHNQAIWRCKCECGNEHEALGMVLGRGEAKSCGCLKHDTPAPNRTHNMTKTPLFRVWCTMRNRCEDPAVNSYPDYGGRGIKVCERWQKFENFLADMGERPSDRHSIDRRDNNGDYCPENCYWATKVKQNSNKRNTRLLTANGETLHMAEWARRLGCNPAAILARLNAGMSEEEAVTKPVPERPNSKLTMEQAREIRSIYPGLTMLSLAKKYGVSKKTVLNILHGKIFREE